MKEERAVLVYSAVAVVAIVGTALVAYWQIAYALHVAMQQPTWLLFCVLLAADIQLDARFAEYRAARRYLLGAALAAALHFARDWAVEDALAAPLACAIGGWLLWRPADAYARSWPKPRQ